MLCPMCQGRSSVVDTVKTSRSVLRRRECYDCEYRWNTKELVYRGWIVQQVVPKKPEEFVKSKPKDEEKPLRMKTPPMDMHVPVERGVSEDTVEALREAGIDYEWSQNH